MAVLKRLVLLIGILFTTAACLQEEKLKQNFNGFSPKVTSDNWAISTPQAENVNEELLNKSYQLVYDDERFPMARSLLVIRNNKLIAEAYPNSDEDFKRLNNIQSCTKSFTSLAVGIAMQKGLISNLDEKLYSIYPQYFDDDIRKRDLSLRHALSMQTGLEFDNGVHTLDLYQNEGSSIEYVLRQNFLHRPGLLTNYNDGAPQLVSAALAEKTGTDLADFINQELFQPLEIENWQWEKASDGITYGAFSLFLKPRDLAKVGQLLLQNGRWKGQQIVDSAYLAEARSAVVTTSGEGKPYGYYFWVYPAWEGFAAIGHGGQFLLVVPEKELVAVYTAWPYTSPKLFDNRDELMQLLVAACE